MGMLSLPTMLKRGYSKELATGTIAASGTLGQIIPPSIVLILLASQMGLDIGNVFKAAVTPGLILVGLYLVYALIFAWLKPDAAPAMPDEDLAAFRQGNMVKRICFAFLSPLILIIAVLGSIFAGIASPTEAAGVGALGAMILTILHGRFSLKTLRAVMRETTHLTSMVFIILCGATAFSLVFWKLGGEEALIGERADRVAVAGYDLDRMVMNTTLDRRTELIGALPLEASLCVWVRQIDLMITGHRRHRGERPRCIAVPPKLSCIRPVARI